MRYFLILVTPLLLFLGLGFFSSCTNSKSNNTIDKESRIELVKRKEIVIKHHLIKGFSPFSYFNLFPRRFVTLKNRYVVIQLQEYTYYIIDLETNEYRRICSYGIEPGESFFSPQSLNITDKDEIVVNDCARRINIFNHTGDYVKSYILPDNYFIPWTVNKYNNQLILSGMDITLLDINSGESKRLCGFTDKEIGDIRSRTPGGMNIMSMYFDITPEGNLLISKPIDHKIYEYSFEGELIHTYDEIPSHYVSLQDIEPYKEGEREFNKNKNWLSRSNNGWYNKWSTTGFPSIYRNDYFVVARGVQPPIYVDLYSIKEKKYIGSFETEGKPFLYSDEKNIYLLEEISDKKMVISGYEAIIDGENHKPILNNDFTRFLITIKDRVEDIPYKSLHKILYEKEYKEVNLYESLSDFTIKGIDGKKHRLQDYLDHQSEYHFLIIIRAMTDCVFSDFRKKVKQFCEFNKNFDYHYILNHQYEEELINSSPFYFFNESVTIFNSEPERMLGFYPKSIEETYPDGTIVLVDNDGNILCHFENDYESFFNEVIHISKMNLK